MPTPINYDITLEFSGEPRLSEYHPTDLNTAIEYALDFARKNRGVQVRVAATVPMSGVHNHSYSVFECQFPVLEPFMQTNIRRHFGQLPE